MTKHQKYRTFFKKHIIRISQVEKNYLCTSLCDDYFLTSTNGVFTFFKRFEKT